MSQVPSYEAAGEVERACVQVEVRRGSMVRGLQPSPCLVSLIGSEIVFCSLVHPYRDSTPYPRRDEGDQTKAQLTKTCIASHGETQDARRISILPAPCPGALNSRK